MKYKVLVIALWALSAIGAFGIACPRTPLANDIGAKLISSADPSLPVYMIRNESTQTWEDVEVLVNNRYRATLTALGGGTGSITLSSAVLFDEQGAKAPSRLQVINIRLKVRKPSADVWLLRNGVMEK